MILVIDGPGLSHRAFHVVRNEHNAALISRIFWSSIGKLIKEHKATAVFVLWDGSHPKHRQVQADTYKAGREDLHESTDASFMFESRRYLREYLPKAGVHSIKIDGAEADDLSKLFSVVLYPEHKGMFIGGDYDWVQSVTDNWSFQHISHAGKKSIDMEWLRQHTQAEDRLQDRFIIMKALEGDGSDCITGIHGCGYVNAVKISNSIITKTPIPNTAVGRRAAAELPRIQENVSMIEFDWILSEQHFIESIKEQIKKTEFDLTHVKWVSIQAPLKKDGAYSLRAPFDALKPQGQEYVDHIQQAKVPNSPKLSSEDLFNTNN